MAETTTPRSGTDPATRVAGTVAAVAAAFVAQRLITGAWRTVTGTTPDDDDDSPLTEVLVFAALSAAATRSAATQAPHWAAARRDGAFRTVCIVARLAKGPTLRCASLRAAHPAKAPSRPCAGFAELP